MAKDLPFYKFNVAEFLLGRISKEKPDIIGIFVVVGAHYWHMECSTTREELEEKTKKSWISKLIDKGYLVISDLGGINLPFLDEQRVELLTGKKKQSEGGKKAMENRYSKPKVLITLRERGERDIDKEEEKEEREIVPITSFLIGGEKVFNLKEFLVKKFPDGSAQLQIHFGRE